MSPPPFQIVLDSHGAEVLRFLVAMVGRQHAEDCFQDTLLAALHAYPQLRDPGRVRAWLLAIAHRKAIDAHRARRRAPVPVAQAPEPAAGERERPDDELWGQVAALPPRQRAAVVLRFVSDLSYAQVAEVAGCSEEAARRNVHEALRKLRRTYRP